MIKTQIIGYLGHDNKLFDRTCAECGGIFDKNATPTCPRCNRDLTPITTKSGKAMMVSEGTIYPEMTQKQKDAMTASRAKRKASMEITYRFVLFSFANSETGIITEPPVHKYLVKGRQVMIESNHIPVISWFRSNNDEIIKCEVRFSILTNEGDYVKLLGKKEVIDDMFVVPPEVATKTQAAAAPAVPDDAQAPPDNSMALELADLQKQLNILISKNQAQPATEKHNVETVIESDDVSIF